MNTPTDLKYTCPVCGKPGEAGKHFCNTAKCPGNKPRKTVGPAVWGAAGALLVVVLLWTWVGSWSLPVAAAVLLAVWLVDRTKKSGNREYAELVKLCGSKETAVRLVDAETRRRPGSTKKEAVQTALDRLSRDRTR